LNFMQNHSTGKITCSEYKHFIQLCRPSSQTIIQIQGQFFTAEVFK
jgi:hypothetical protein